MAEDCGRPLVGKQLGDCKRSAVHRKEQIVSPVLSVFIGPEAFGNPVFFRRHSWHLLL